MIRFKNIKILCLLPILWEKCPHEQDKCKCITSTTDNPDAHYRTVRSYDNTNQYRTLLADKRPVWIFRITQNTYFTFARNRAEGGGGGDGGAPHLIFPLRSYSSLILSSLAISRRTYATNFSSFTAEHLGSIPKKFLKSASAR